jgi:hypothetical protein
MHYNASFVRLNSEDVTNKNLRMSIDIASNRLIIGNQEINMDEINVVWYRRWYEYRDIGFKPANKHERQLMRELQREAEAILFYLFYAMQDKVWLTDPVVNKLHNKLFALHAAQSLGLSIPASFITNHTEEVIGFMKANENIITKPIGDPSVYFDPDGTNYKNYTEKLTLKMLKKLPPQIFMSLFQQMVNAECEIRTFYLDGDFYSTAILHSGTTDIKLSVKRDMNVKMVAYDLPADVKQKLRLLMKQLNLNTGSIDIIKSKDGIHYFLEVNPIGQFTGYGFSCNYHLEKIVAEWLIKKDHQRSSYEKKSKIHERIPAGFAGQNSPVLQVHE